MPRTKNEADVETVDEVEETVDTPEGAAEGEAKAAKKKAEPKRGDLPEGYVTPIGLAKELTKRGLHTNREGEVVEVRPQMVYSYIKNAPKEDAFPMETITDSIGAERNVVKLDAGVAWWERKNARVAERRQNAAAKEAKKAERAAAQATATEAEADSAEAEGQAEEAE